MANENNQTALTPIKRFNQCIANASTQEYLQSILGEKKSSFVANVTALVTNNVQLQECAPMSVMYAAIKATALDLPLDPSLGCAYVIPFRNNKLNRTDAQFQLGAKGLVQLALRSGQFINLNNDVVYEGELVRFDKKSGEPDLSGVKTSDNVIGYFAYFKLLNGFEKTLYMSKDEVEKHGVRFSQTYKADKKNGYSSSVWTNDFDSMAKKTVLKLLLQRWAPKSVETLNLQKALADDQVVVNDRNESQYIDNPEVDEQVAVEEQQGIALDKAKDALEKAEQLKRRVRTAPSVVPQEPVSEPEGVFGSNA